MSEETYIAVSGGFDPVQVGHGRMIYDASAFGKVIVILNSDEWLIRKKGYAFMPFAERKEILERFRNVHCVLPAIDEDGTIEKNIEMLKDTIDFFGNGGDRFEVNTPEDIICRKYGIIPLYGLGGHKIQSSSDLVKNVRTH